MEKEKEITMKKSELRQLINEIVRRKLREADESTQSFSTSAQDSDQSNVNQNAAKVDPTLVAKQKALDDQKKKLEDLSNKVKKAEANIAKREQTLKKANMKDQIEKDAATRKQGPVISKINAIQKDIEKKTQQI